MKVSGHIKALAGMVIAVCISAGCDRLCVNADYDPNTEEQIKIKMSACPDSSEYYIEEAVEDGLITKRHGQYLHALYLTRYMNDYKTAISILEELDTYYDKHRPACKEDSILSKDILRSLSKNHFNIGQYGQSMHYSVKASKAYREGNEDDSFIAAEMDCHIGNTFLRMGKKEEGLELIQKATEHTAKSPRFTAFYSWLNCMSAKATAYHDLESYDKVIEICNQVHNKLKRFDSCTDVPLYYQEKSNREELRDYYQGLFEAFKASTYSKMNMPDSARVSVGRCLETYWGKSHEYTSMNLVMAYTALGMREKFDSCYNCFRERFGDDTVQERMLYFLECEKTFAQSENNPDKAYSFSQRVKALEELMYQRLVSAQIAQNAAMFEANQMETEMKNEAEHDKLLWPKHALIFASVFMFLLLYYYHIKKSRQVESAYKALMERQRIIDTNALIIEKAATAPTNKDSVLFDKVLHEMRRTKPYLQDDFSINTLAGLLNTNSNYISRAINYGSGKTFPQWIAEYRNHIAIEALQKKPDLTINEVCNLTGHSSRETFSRQFKTLNGMSFSDFKSQNKNTNKG